MSPTRILEKVSLTQDITLDNSSDIYIKIAGLFDQQGVIRTSIPDMSSATVSIAWLNNPIANNATYKLVLHKGTSVLGSIQQVANRRNEVLFKTQNYILIRPSTKPSLLPTYEEKTMANQGDLYREANAVILSKVSLLQLDGEPMEEFVNAKLKESSALFFNQDKSTVPFTFKMDEVAKSQVGKTNVIGMWTYRDLLDALCALTGLRWKIDDNTLWLEKAGSVK